MKDFIELFEDAAQEKKTVTLENLPKFTARDFLVMAITFVIRYEEPIDAKELFMKRFDIITRTWGIKKRDINNAANNRPEMFKQRYKNLPDSMIDLLVIYLKKNGIKPEDWFKADGIKIVRGLVPFYKAIVSNYDMYISKEFTGVAKHPFGNKLYEAYEKYKKRFVDNLQSPDHLMPLRIEMMLNALMSLIRVVMVAAEIKAGRINKSF